MISKNNQYDDYFPISGKKISNLLKVINKNKEKDYYWNSELEEKLIHDSFCKYVLKNGINKGLICKKKSSLHNNFCPKHCPDLNVKYPGIRCWWNDRKGKKCTRLIKKDNENKCFGLCYNHLPYFLEIKLPKQNEKELLDLGVSYSDIYDINKIDIDIFTYNIFSNYNLLFEWYPYIEYNNPYEFNNLMKSSKNNNSVDINKNIDESLLDEETEKDTITNFNIQNYGSNILNIENKNNNYSEDKENVSFFDNISNNININVNKKENNDKVYICNLLYAILDVLMYRDAEYIHIKIITIIKEFIDLFDIKIEYKWLKYLDKLLEREDWEMHSCFSNFYNTSYSCEECRKIYLNGFDKDQEYTSKNVLDTNLKNNEKIYNIITLLKNDKNENIVSKETTIEIIEDFINKNIDILSNISTEKLNFINNFKRILDNKNKLRLSDINKLKETVNSFMNIIENNENIFTTIYKYPIIEKVDNLQHLLLEKTKLIFDISKIIDYK